MSFSKTLIIPLLTLFTILSGAAEPFPLDQLARQGERHGTFGPTGKRLNCDYRAPGLGLRGRYQYIHYQGQVPDLVRIQLARSGVPLEPASTEATWYPSHFAYACATDSLFIRENKWITDDDVAFTTLILQNTGEAPLPLDIEVSSAFAVRRANGGQSALDLSAVANLDPAPRGRMSALVPNSMGYGLWWEGEDPARQHGSTGRDGKTAASGGEVLGSGFGGDAGHFAEYTLDLPALPPSLLWLRAARPMNGTATWVLSLDGDPLGTLEIPRTSGWGGEPTEFVMMCITTPRVVSGSHTFRIESAAEGINTNFDGFLLSDLAYVPRSGDAPPYRARVSPRFPLPLKDVTHTGIDFSLAGCKSLVALSGGPPDSPARALPDRITIPVPDGEGRVDQVHFLGQTGAYLDGVASGATIGRYRIRMANGAEETIPLIAGSTFPDARGAATHLTRHGNLYALSATLNHPGRVREIVFEKADSPVAPVLAAITLERFDKGDTRLVGALAVYGTTLHGMLDSRLRGPDGRAIPSTHGARGMHYAVTLAPGENATLSAALAMDVSPETCASRDAAWLGESDPLAAHRAQYAAWFDNNCPRFAGSDPFMEKAWTYRWFVARHCLARPEMGNLQYPFFYEGLRYYARLITYSSCHIMAETRWLRDPQYAFGQVRNHAAVAHGGAFCDAIVDQRHGFFTNWVSYAAWQAYLVHNDPDYLREIAPAMADDVHGLLAVDDKNNNLLLSPHTHWITGMEWQPAYWYYANFDNTRPEARIERPDFTAYVYGSARATAAAFRELGNDARSAEFDTLADGIRDAALKYLWYPEHHFFYSVHEADQSVAFSREIVNFYPFMFGLPPDEPEYLSTLHYLIDPNDFWNPYPVATVSRTHPAYSPHVHTWPIPGGQETYCMWNGPTWPHCNSIIANAMANAIRDYHQEIIRPEKFWEFMRQFTLLHFEGNDLGKPMIQEYNDGETGEHCGCYDYFHSTYNDLLIRDLAGLRPSAEKDVIRLDPIPSDVEWFRLDGVRYHGHDVSIHWKKRGTRDPRAREMKSGLRLYVDGELVERRRTLGPLRGKLQAGG